MRTKYIFGLLSLMLMVTFAFSMVATSAMGANRKAVTAAGVIRGEPFPDGEFIIFTVDENFMAERIAMGVYLITVDERLECTFLANGDQAALGPRFATPVAFPGNDHNYYITSDLVFVETDIAGVCNALAVYQFQLYVRGTTDDPVNKRVRFPNHWGQNQVGNCILQLRQEHPGSCKNSTSKIALGKIHPNKPDGVGVFRV